jgi:hypothetical protein
MSLRDQLRGRALPTEVVRLPVDRAAYARCERELSAAQWELEQARGAGGRDTAALRARAAAAQASLNAQQCVEVTLRTLPPPEWEALVEMHRATEEQQAQRMLWNPATFNPAVLAACVVPADGDEPMSADDWAQLVKAGELTMGEYRTLCDAAISLNLREPSSAVGKGS